MKHLSGRLVLLIFRVLWITLLLFLGGNKKTLEVLTGLEVQTPKVPGLVALQGAVPLCKCCCGQSTYLSQRKLGF